MNKLIKITLCSLFIVGSQQFIQALENAPEMAKTEVSHEADNSVYPSKIAVTEATTENSSMTDSQKNAGDKRFNSDTKDMKKPISLENLEFLKTKYQKQLDNNTTNKKRNISQQALNRVNEEIAKLQPTAPADQGFIIKKSAPESTEDSSQSKQLSQSKPDDNAANEKELVASDAQKPKSMTPDVVTPNKSDKQRGLEFFKNLETSNQKQSNSNAKTVKETTRIVKAQPYEEDESEITVVEDQTTVVSNKPVAQTAQLPEQQYSMNANVVEPVKNNETPQNNEQLSAQRPLEAYKPQQLNPESVDAKNSLSVGKEHSNIVMDESVKAAFKTLGLDPQTATLKDLNTFKKLALKNHPDRGGDTKTFQLINDARDTLKEHFEAQPTEENTTEADTQTEASNKPLLLTDAQAVDMEHRDTFAEPAKPQELIENNAKPVVDEKAESQEAQDQVKDSASLTTYIKEFVNKIFKGNKAEDKVAVTNESIKSAENSDWYKDWTVYKTWNEFSFKKWLDETSKKVDTYRSEKLQAKININKQQLDKLQTRLKTLNDKIAQKNAAVDDNINAKPVVDEKAESQEAQDQVKDSVSLKTYIKEFVNKIFKGNKAEDKVAATNEAIKSAQESSWSKDWTVSKIWNESSFKQWLDETATKVDTYRLNRLTKETSSGESNKTPEKLQAKINAITARIAARQSKAPVTEMKNENEVDKQPTTKVEQTVNNTNPNDIVLTDTTTL